jgi:hypothetical protein
LRNKSFSFALFVCTRPAQTEAIRLTSYNYIARTAGIIVDTLKDSLYLHELVNGHTESKEAWMKRRFVSAYRNKTIAGKSYSALMICELAGIDWKIYNKHPYMFKVWLDDPATENEINQG